MAKNSPKTGGMTPDALAYVGTLLWGENWRKGLVENTGLSRTHLARVLAGEYPLPEGIQPKLKTLVARRIRDLNEVFREV